MHYCRTISVTNCTYIYTYLGMSFLKALKEKVANCTCFEPFLCTTMPNFSYYLIGNNGTFYSLRRGPELHEMKPRSRHKGSARLRMTLIDDFGVSHTHSVAAWMAVAFDEVDLNSQVVDHIDRNPFHNHLPNLRVCSQADNMKNVDWSLLDPTRKERPVIRIDPIHKSELYYSKIDLAAKVIAKDSSYSSKVRTIASGISNCLAGRSKTSYKYQWKYYMPPVLPGEVFVPISP